MKHLILLAIALFAVFSLKAQSDSGAVMQALDARSSQYGRIANEIWTLAEMGYQEEKSAALLQSVLADEGFRIEKGVVPTSSTSHYWETGIRPLTIEIESGIASLREFLCFFYIPCNYSEETDTNTLTPATT